MADFLTILRESVVGGLRCRMADTVEDRQHRND
jgi:hypothetical protein